MLKCFTVTYHYGNPASHGCGGGTDVVEVKAHDQADAERRAFKKKKPYEYFEYSTVGYSGPRFVAIGLDIFAMPQERHVATAVSHAAKKILLERLNEITPGGLG